MKVWLRDGLVDEEQALVSVFDHGLTVGDGVFETVKVVGGRPFALTRHLDRLAGSARGLGLPVPDAGAVRAAVAALLAAEPAADPGDRQRLRITVTGGPSPMGSERGQAGPTLIVAVAPLAVWPPTAAVATVPWPRNERGALAGLKSTSYGENVVALAHARRLAAGEAVFANTAGLLCEGTGSNVFVELDGRIVTPSLASGCLAGVTRALVVEWSAVAECDVPVEALAAAREVFLTSTTREVQPVHAVDGRPVGDGTPGLATREIRDAFARRAADNLDP